MSDKDGLFLFAEEEKAVDKDLKIWKILSVEDDLDYQNALINSLKVLNVKDGYKFELLTANSVSQAALALSMHPDIALIFIDVVMEDDDSGLRLVNTIREIIGNAEMRIVLLTGQPGFAPEAEVMKVLDIDEYWNKSDISVEKLQSIVNSNMRTWEYISQIKSAKQGLQLVLDASRSINSKHDMASFSYAVLEEISNILNVTQGGGIFCSSNSSIDCKATILSTQGCFRGAKGTLHENTLSEEIYQDFQSAIERRQHVFAKHHSVFFFGAPAEGEVDYITIVKSNNTINEQHEYLLKVFSENVNTGFSNISLLNRLTELAYTDVTLNLKNRNWLMREIKNMNSRERLKTRLLLFDIYQFDEKSFTFGHEFCNKLIKLVHDSITSVFAQEMPRIALISNRAFGLLVSDDFDIAEGVKLFQSKQQYEIENVKQFIDVSTLELELSSVIGLSPDKIINLAESSLTIKSNQVHYIKHTKEKTQAIARRYQLMAQLRTAIGTKSLEVALQPKMSLSSLTPVGFEALARWRLSDGSFVRPDEFIELAETAGLINELDNVIFEKVLQSIKVLNSHGFNLPVAFNASSYDLVNPDYFNQVKSKIDAHGISPSQLEIEVTETQAISNYGLIKETLERFKALGLKVSIDDFGTGYSSLAHINEIPSTSIKIDQYFVTNLESNKNNQYMIKMILSLAEQYNFLVIAEGVENEFEASWLLEQGCETAQGYYFSKPQFMDDLLIWLNRYTDKHE